MTCCERIKFAFSKLIMEFFGTFVFTLLFLTRSDGIMLLGLWVLTIFSWKISASQLNPAVTLAFMLRNDSKRIHVSMGLLMMGAQCAGAYCASLYFTFVSWTTIPQATYGKVAWYAICQETFGAFIFVLFFKIVTDERLHLSGENAINCFVIAASYIAARSIVNGVKPGVASTYGACLNPAVAFGITLTGIMGNYAD